MADVNALLTARLKQGDRSSKMATMAKQSAAGQLTSFTGVFGVSDLTGNEKSFLENLLRSYALDEEDVPQDLAKLSSITSEVKAINNQAVLLHGERIKKARDILTRYRDGAFSAWLVAAYGNRQTPYNFLQYFEFYEALPRPLKVKAESMPRQAIYTLASRIGSSDKKHAIVSGYSGETKSVLLQRIRETFPLDSDDKRREDIGDTTIKTLMKLCASLHLKQRELSKSQRRAIVELISELQSIVE